MDARAWWVLLGVCALPVIFALWFTIMCARESYYSKDPHGKDK